MIYFSDFGSTVAYAAPTYVGKSTEFGSQSAGTIDFTSSGRQAGDWLIIAIASANEAISAPGVGTEVPTHSPQGQGTGGASSAIRLAVFTAVSSGSETTVSIPDPGNTVYAIGIVVRPDTGANLAIDTSAGKAAAAAGSQTGNAITTSVPNCLVIDIFATDRDSVGPTYSSETNADLTGLAERHDAGTSFGNGSGIAIFTGTKVSAGSVAATAVTSSVNIIYNVITLALKNVP